MNSQAPVALAEMPARSGELRLEAADEVDGAVLQERGFELERKLAWMAIRLGPTPTTLADGGEALPV